MKVQVIGAIEVILFDTMYSLIGFKKSTPPQNRRPNILISNGKQ